MVVARRLTRGLGEKTQAKEIRCSQYPQVGLKESIIPDAVNTRLSGTDIMSIRVDSHFNPVLINSPRGEYPNYLNLPFFNMKKGNDGRGVTVSNGKSIAWAVNWSAGSSRPSNICSTGIESFSWGAFAYKFADLGQVSWESDENNMTRFDLLEGGTTQGVDYKKDGKIFMGLTFNGFTKVLFIPEVDATYLESFKGNNYGVDYLNQGMEHYGSLQYSQCNTNQNNSASWLLHQRTQYQRQFNPLFTLGI